MEGAVLLGKRMALGMGIALGGLHGNDICMVTMYN